MLRGLLASAVAAAAVVAGPGRIVALQPLQLPFESERAGEIRTTLETGIATRLRAAGWTVIAPADVGEVWNRRLQAAGGFYDPVTGDTIAAKYREVHDGALRELRERFGATAWLRTRVETVVAPWRGGKAQWDGAAEGVAPVGEGRVPALTLAVALEDSAGRILGAGRGGLQVLARVKGGRYERVADEKLLQDAKRTAKAVDLALAPLLGERRP